jgi:hypothetical protein
MMNACSKNPKFKVHLIIDMNLLNNQDQYLSYFQDFNKILENIMTSKQSTTCPVKNKKNQPWFASKYKLEKS